MGRHSRLVRSETVRYASGIENTSSGQTYSDFRLYIIAATLLLTGYTGTKLFYDGVFNLPEGATHDSISFPFFVLILFACLAGAGGSAVCTGASHLSTDTHIQKFHAGSHWLCERGSAEFL